MRYLGLLYDSLREALDTKVMYITFALSLLLIFLVAGIQFRPVTVKDEADRVAGFTNWIFGMQAQGKMVKGAAAACTVADYQQTPPDAPPWQADYQFAFVLRLPAANFEELQKKFFLEEYFKEQMWYLQDLKLAETVSADGREIRIAVTAHGTKIDNLQAWQHQPSLFFGLVPLSWHLRSSLTYAVYLIENRLVNTIGGWAIILISVIVTAGFIPNMLQRGSVDLLLIKPISRPALLIFKYLGGLTFVFVNALIAIGGVWLVLSLRTGVWSWTFPLSVLILTAFFAILYAVSTLFGVLTHNSIICIFMTCLVWLGLFMLGMAHASYNEPPRNETNLPAPPPASLLADDQNLEPVEQAVNVLHFMLPRTDDLGRLTTQLLSQELLSKEERRAREFRDEQPFSWGESLSVSAAFIALVLGLACWRFAVRDC